MTQHSDENKFQTFRPKTPTEMTLHNEIRRLQRVNYVLMREKGVMPYQCFKREEAVVDFEPSQKLTLLMGARLIGQIDEQGLLSVDARCYGKDNKALGFAYYVMPQELQEIHKTADILMHQHERFVHEMAVRLEEAF